MITRAWTGRSGLFLALALGAVGCNKDKKESIPGKHNDDTGQPTDSGGSDGADGGDDTAPPPCTAFFLESTPADGDDDVYFRDHALLRFDGSDIDAQVDVTAVDSSGADLTIAVEFDESGLNATVLAPTDWPAAQVITLNVSVCGEVTPVSFETSEYGAPLTGDVTDLIGRTFFIDLGDAEYAKPAGLGPLIATYLSQPLLVGVEDVSDETIELMGALGYIDSFTGELYQDTSAPSFDFGVADFRGNPYFSASTDSLVILYEGVSVDIFEFHIEGTFDPAMESIGGGIASGLVDTRNVGELMGVGSDPDAACTLAESFGIDCVDCPDGNPWCLEIEGYLDPAPLIPGMELVPVL